MASGSTVQNLAVTPNGVSKAISTALENYYNKSYIDTTLSNYLTTAAASQTYLTINEAESTYIAINLMGVSDGVATLDNNGKILVGQLPDYLLGQVLFGGTVERQEGSDIIVSVSTNLAVKLGIGDDDPPVPEIKLLQLQKVELHIHMDTNNLKVFILYGALMQCLMHCLKTTIILQEIGLSLLAQLGLKLPIVMQ